VLRYWYNNRLTRHFKNFSVSQATHVWKDVVVSIQAFLLTLGCDKVLTYEQWLEGEPDTKENQCMYLNEYLWNIIDGIAPVGCYFGAHPGDGSDFGFWESDEQ
jgi:hypothetical protein